MWVQMQGVLQKNCLTFHKMNRCHYLLEPIVIIPMFPDVGMVIGWNPLKIRNGLPCIGSNILTCALLWSNILHNSLPPSPPHYSRDMEPHPVRAVDAKMKELGSIWGRAPACPPRSANAEDINPVFQ